MTDLPSSLSSEGSASTSGSALLIPEDSEFHVDLGDFSAVWQFLNSPSQVLSSLDDRDEHIIDRPASRKQLQKKEIVFDEKVTVKQKTGKKTTSTQEPLADRSSKELSRTEGLRIKSSRKQLKGKAKETNYSSADDDGEESSWYPSSFEDKKSTFSSYRRKSFLYIPPTFTSPNLPVPPPSITPAAPSAADRRRSLIQKLIAKYPSEVDRILAQPTTPNYTSTLSTPASKELHIFVDNSNILIGFYEAYKSKHGVTDPFFRAPKFDFHAFATILERGRPVSTKFLAGSNPLVQPVALAEHLGYQVSILERVVDSSKPAASTSAPYESDPATRTLQREKKKEQAVDEILHLRILECILDVPTPGIIVLATGDAAPAEFSPDGGFLKCIQRALKRGWDVELVCWRRSMSRLWREKAFRAESGKKFKVIELDDFVDELLLE